MSATAVSTGTATAAPSATKTAAKRTRQQCVKLAERAANPKDNQTPQIMRMLCGTQFPDTLPTLLQRLQREGVEDKREAMRQIADAIMELRAAVARSDKVVSPMHVNQATYFVVLAVLMNMSRRVFTGVFNIRAKTKAVQVSNQRLGRVIDRVRTSTLSLCRYADSNIKYPMVVFGAHSCFPALVRFIPCMHPSGKNSALSTQVADAVATMRKAYAEDVSASKQTMKSAKPLPVPESVLDAAVELSVAEESMRKELQRPGMFAAGAKQGRVFVDTTTGQLISTLAATKRKRAARKAAQKAAQKEKKKGKKGAKEQAEAPRRPVKRKRASKAAKPAAEPEPASESE